MNEFLKNFSYVDVILANGSCTYIECNVEIERALPMLDGLRVERIDIYLDDDSEKVVVYAEDYK